MCFNCRIDRKGEVGPLLMKEDLPHMSVAQVNNPGNTSSVSYEEEEEKDNNREDNNREDNREDREGLPPLDVAYSDGRPLEDNEEEEEEGSSRDSSGYLSREGVQPLDAANSDRGLLEENVSDDDDDDSAIKSVESMRSP
ncbi:hypothetical protein KUCAC02_013420 [Chaenocephalus aceratus]|nr:hypothetical protein KUCAC02_013420 [Chaenocephalus aceratus]